MTEQHKDNLACGTGLIKLNFMQVYLNKNSYFLALRTVALEVHSKGANWFASVSGVTMQKKKVTGIYQIHRKDLSPEIF